MNEEFIPNYLIDYSHNSVSSKEKTKCTIKCTCGNQVFNYIHLYFSRSHPFTDKMMELNKSADNMFESKVGPFKNLTDKNRHKLIPSWTGRTIDGVDYWILFAGHLGKDKYASLNELKNDEHYLAYINREDYKDNLPLEFEYVKAKCKNCGKEILLFDSRYYGYDGVCTHYEEPDKEYGTDGKMKQKNPHCEGSGYKIFVTFSSTGKEDLLENMDDGVITEENWKDAFDWITIQLECNKCGKKVKVLDLETM